jgi:hypothetical protein
MEKFDKNLEPLFNVLNEWLDLDQVTFQRMQPELRLALSQLPGCKMQNPV